MSTESKLIVDQLEDNNHAVTVNVTDIALKSELSESYLTYINSYPGVDPTGAVDSTAALTEAMVAGNTVIIPKGTTILASPAAGLAGYLIVEGTLVLSGTCTVSCTVNVRGGNIQTTSGAAATFTGSFAANPGVQIFSGAGAVYGIRHVYPEWWGAKADNTTDSTAAIQAALNCLANSASVLGLRPTFEAMSGQYIVSSTLTVPNSASIGVEFKGQGVIFAGTRFRAAASFTGDAVISCVGSNDSTQQIADFHFHNFGILPVTTGAGATRGLQLGTTSTKLIGLKESQVHDVYIERFTYGLALINTRLINFQRVGIWNGSMTTASSCVFIQGENAFCGDMTFHSCQFVNNTAISGSRDIYIACVSSYSSNSSQVAGIRFTECILYPADKSIYIAALNGGHVEDIFITTCQFDGSNNCMLWVDCSGSGSLVADLQLLNNYMYGGNLQSGTAQIQFVTASGGIMRNIAIIGGTLGNGVGRAINFTSDATSAIFEPKIRDVTIVDFYNSSGNQPIEIGQGCVRASIVGVVGVRKNVGNKYPNLVKIDSGALRTMVALTISDDARSGTAVLDSSGDSNNVIVNNI